jgi:cytoplasmic iron level regulating protein YaaA (DUF328/UPF0246 family)
MWDALYMLMLISPAKTLDLETPPQTKKFTQPDFLAESALLIERLRSISPAELGSLMHISDALAQLNVARYASWTPEFSLKNAKQAIHTFHGEVYAGLDAATLNDKQLSYLQSHLRILSGLYGMLRPLDLMQAYRLEMGTRLDTARSNHLYAFWGDAITQSINQQIAEKKANAVVNLASEEYFKVVKPKLLTVPLITPVFEDGKNGQYKVISFFAKRARGLMVRYAAQNGIAQAEKLKDFTLGGYAFAAEQSDGTRWVFRRAGEPA